MTPRLDLMAKKYFGPNMPSIRELEQRTALAFVNTNPVVDYVAPLPENVIPVAGLQIKDPKPLPNVISIFTYYFCDIIDCVDGISISFRI